MVSNNREEVTQTVIVRKMPRRWYLKYHAKDSEGQYIGTEKVAVDAGPVFVQNKSTPKDYCSRYMVLRSGRNIMRWTSRLDWDLG